MRSRTSFTKPEPAVLAGDLAGAGVAANLRYLTERDELAAGRGDKHVAEPLDVVALVAFEAHLNREPLAAFDGGGEILPAKSGFHHF